VSGILRAVRLAKMIGEEAFSSMTAFSLTVENAASPRRKSKRTLSVRVKQDDEGAGQAGDTNHSQYDRASCTLPSPLHSFATLPQHGFVEHLDKWSFHQILVPRRGQLCSPLRPRGKLSDLWAVGSLLGFCTAGERLPARQWRKGERIEGPEHWR
jgi:hypothetical protein